jgi:hypothetical protein
MTRPTQAAGARSRSCRRLGPPFMGTSLLTSHGAAWRRYHGKLKFPPDYPFAPPGIMMHTPSGRFEVNMRLCLSMSEWPSATARFARPCPLLCVCVARPASAALDLQP